MIDPAKFYTTSMRNPSRLRQWLLWHVTNLGAFPRLRYRLLRIMGY